MLTVSTACAVEKRAGVLSMKGGCRVAGGCLVGMMYEMCVYVCVCVCGAVPMTLVASLHWSSSKAHSAAPCSVQSSSAQGGVQEAGWRERVGMNGGKHGDIVATCM